MSTTDNRPFVFGERLGIFMTILASLLSAISALGLLIYAMVRGVKRWRSFRRRGTRHSRGRSDASGFSLFVSLVTADLVQALGGIPYWRWMLEAKVTEGPLCTFQGVFLNLGNIAIAFSSLSIAVHTFVVFVLHWRVTRYTLRTVVVGIWVLAALIVVVCGRGRPGYYADTGYWCWVANHHDVERIVGEYLWMWIAFFVMIGLYVFLFVMMLRGTTIEGDDGIERSEEEEAEYRESRKMAYSMLYFPVVYLVCLAPVSISRWLGWSRSTPLPPAAILFSNTVFSLSGFLNLILFSITRPSLIIGTTESTGSPDGSHGISILEEEPKPSHTHLPSDSSERLGNSLVQRSGDGAGEDLLQVGEHQRSISRSYGLTGPPSSIPASHSRGHDARVQGEGRLPE